MSETLLAAIARPSRARLLAHEVVALVLELVGEFGPPSRTIRPSSMMWTKSGVTYWEDPRVVGDDENAQLRAAHGIYAVGHHA